MEKPSKTTKEAAKALFREGYLKAAASLAALSGKKADITKMEITFSAPGNLLEKLSDKKDFTVLLTEVIGDARGKSFLVLDPYEVDKLSEMMLSKLKNFDNTEEFREIILKELDNVMAAAVITVLANFLNLKIFGDVPHIIKPEENTHAWLEKELSKARQLTAIHSAVDFTFEDDIKLQPSFFWILDEHFYNALNQKAERHENSSLS